MSEKDEQIFVQMVIKAAFAAGWCNPGGHQTPDLNLLSARVTQLGHAGKAAYRAIWGASEAPEPEGFDPGYAGYQEVGDAYELPNPWKKDRWPDVKPATMGAWVHEELSYGKYEGTAWNELPSDYLEWMVEAMENRNRKFIKNDQAKVARAKALLLARQTGPGHEETPF